jgi:hypothetical protein
VTLNLAAGGGNSIKVANASDWAPDIDRIVVAASQRHHRQAVMRPRRTRPR